MNDDYKTRRRLFIGIGYIAICAFFNGMDVLSHAITIQQGAIDLIRAAGSAAWAVIFPEHFSWFIKHGGLYSVDRALKTFFFLFLFEMAGAVIAVLLYVITGHDVWSALMRNVSMFVVGAIVVALVAHDGDDDGEQFRKGLSEKAKELMRRIVQIHGPQRVPAGVPA